MDWNSALVVFNIVNEWGATVINWPNCLSGTKVNNTLDACWELLLTKLQYTKTTSANYNFGTFSPSLSWSTSFFALTNNFIASGDHNPNLQPVFILKTIVFLILLI